LSNGYTEKYFAPQELMAAARAVGVAASRAKEVETQEDPAKYTSLSRD
jgi:hypothetical protein